ncbi:MAG: TRAP transporter small permease [Rhodospirillales bacterium]|nr:TRAP transporter small permease [Rhodospirillales bacterium]
MEGFLHLARRLTRWSAWFSGALLLAAAFLICVEVTVRKLFSLSIGGAEELSGFALAVGTAWGLVYTLFERGHVRIDSLYIHMSVRIQAALDILGLLIFLLFFGLVMWRGWGVFAESWERDAHTMSAMGTPLIYPQFLWALGLTATIVLGLLLLIATAAAFIQGNLSAVQRLAGSKAAKDELDEEIAISKRLRNDKAEKDPT